MKANQLGPAAQRRAFRARLLDWYERHRRRLPWRGTRDPYRIWVSEIMLQQTRVNAVLGHYREFFHRFPTIRDLARANLSAVLAAWSGLGYYRRARAMHAAARQIMRNPGGRLPQTAEELRDLPGIGPYTAAAVASIAFGEARAVVDGNVERVLRRLLGRPGARRRELWTLAATLISKLRPGDFNQAMMELGATLCLPLAPRCGECPVARWCATRGQLLNTPTAPRNKLRVTYALHTQSNRVSLVRRPSSASLMPDMWELPGASNGAAHKAAVAQFRHAITTTDYQVRVVLSGSRPRGSLEVPVSSLAKLPLTGVTRKILRRFGLL